MTGPLDAVLAFHNAFRRDISLIDEAALALVRGKPGMESQLAVWTDGIGQGGRHHVRRSTTGTIR